MCCNEGHGHRHHHHRHHGGGGGESCDCNSAECKCGEGSRGGRDCGCGGFHRRYRTQAEQISELEEYLAELKAEAQAVEEKLAELRK